MPRLDTGDAPFPGKYERGHSICSPPVKNLNIRLLFAWFGLAHTVTSAGGKLARAEYDGFNVMKKGNH